LLVAVAPAIPAAAHRRISTHDPLLAAHLLQSIRTMMDSNPTPPTPPAAPSNWERAALEKIALAALADQKTARQWGIFFRLLTFMFLFMVLFALLGWIGGKGDIKPPGKHTALIELKGVISAESRASADKIIAALQSAYKDKNTAGIVLRINSPGGSPVQAGYINDEIRRLRAKHPEIPIHAVVQDMCASGGYYVAVAADKIFVDKASLVGSIGVLMDGFGFTGTMDKLGIERRLITAGDNKGFLDPFSPANAEQQEFARKMVAEIHQQFIKVVRDGRGKRLKEAPEMFSGLIWTGERSVQMGLADAFGSLDHVARDVLQAERIVDFTQEDSFSEQLAKRLGTASAESLLNGLLQSRVTLR
jgi:protease-4